MRLVGASAPERAVGDRKWPGAARRAPEEEWLPVPCSMLSEGTRAGWQHCESEWCGLMDWVLVPAWLGHLLNFCELPFSHLHKRVYKSAMYVKHLVLVGKRVVIIILTVVRVVGVLRRE